MKRFTALTVRYFQRVWPPFLTYLLIYKAAWLTGLSVSNTVSIFFLLHAVHAAGLAFFLRENFREKKFTKVDAAFWIVISIFLILPGAYLEYPSDPWEHVRRIFSWSAWEEIYRNDTHERFSYFFGWSFLSQLPHERWRWGLGVYSAFWQLIVLVQFKELLKVLRFERIERRIGVVAYLAFFGTGLFGIRYYGLSGLPLSLIGLYGALLILAEWAATNSKKAQAKLIWLFPLIFLMESNHSGQETFNLALLGGSVFIFKLWRAQNVARRARWYNWGRWALGVSLFYGFVLEFLDPDFLMTTRHRFPLSFWGGFSMFAPELRIYSSLGLAGLLGIFLSLRYFSIRPVLAIFTLMPIFLLVFPPTAQLIMWVLRDRGAVGLYRVTYAFPAGVTFVLLAWEFSAKRFRKWFKNSTASTLAFSACVLGLGSWFHAPVYGRLFLQMYREPAELSLKHLDATADWFRTHRDVSRLRSKCRLLGDDLSYFYLSAVLGLPEAPRRLEPRFEMTKLLHEGKPWDALTGFCGILIADKDRLVESASSLIGQASNHWSSTLADPKTYLVGDAEILIEEFRLHRWSVTDVPPYYLLLEPPNN